MTGRERTLRAIEFRGPDRVPFCCYAPGLTDIFFTVHYPARDWRPEPGYFPNIHPALYCLGNWRYRGLVPLDLYSPGRERQDEFGCVWKSAAPGSIGEVTGHPLTDLDRVQGFPLPDPDAPGRFERFDLYRRLFASGAMVVGNLENGPWERGHFLRGYAGLMMDIAADPDRVGRLLDRLVDEWFIPLVDRYAAHGAHGVIMTDDWGTQRGLMINPARWRELFKPRYRRLFAAARERGLKFFLHSCGHIRDIIPDLIEIGLDVLQKDDLEFMGLEALAERFAGRLCFMGTLDLQRVMPGASKAEIYERVRELILRLGSPDGGLIGWYYAMPEALGVTWGQMLTMHAAFIKHGKYPVEP